MRWMQPAVVTADPVSPGDSAAQLDGGWYLDTVRFAQQTPWLHAPAALYTTYGIFVLALLLLAAWWRARQKSDRLMAAALMAPVSMVLAYLVNDGIKLLVTEPRPCQTLHVVNTVLPCDGVTDWSFPSNHTAVVAAIAAGLFFADRTLAWIATVGAVPLALSRVYVGAHYPHDVLAGLAVGAAVAVLLGLVATRLLDPIVGGLRRGPLRQLLSADPAPPATDANNAATDTAEDSPTQPDTEAQPAPEVEPTTEPARTAADEPDVEPEPDPAEPDSGTADDTKDNDDTEQAEAASAADPAPAADAAPPAEPTPPTEPTPPAEPGSDPVRPAGPDQTAADSRAKKSASATTPEHTR